MKLNRSVIALLLLFGGYIFFELSKPKPNSWQVTFYHEDQEPFGAKAVGQLIKPMFEQEIQNEFITLFEAIREQEIFANRMIIASNFAVDKETTALILEQVAAGRTIFIQAFNFQGPLADTLGLTTAYEDVLGLMPPEQIQEALAGESVNTISLKEDKQDLVIDYPALGSTSFFETQVSDSLEVLAVRNSEEPVLVRYQNNGQLILGTMPLAFTNYFSLLPATTSYTEAVVRLIPGDEALIRNQYYQLGRLENGSPLRVLLGNTSLRWATMLLLLTILIFFIFQSKRQQRIIPVITPLTNLTLEFVQTLGRLYYRQSDHINLGAKRVLYWKDFVRAHYSLNTEHLDEQFAQDLMKKSGKKKELIDDLMVYIHAIDQKQELSDDVLMKFEDKLSEFYGIK